MSEQSSFLPLGYSDLAPGMIATIVTHLEMWAKPSIKAETLPAGMTLERLMAPTSAIYRTLYRLVGTEWLWSSRLLMSDQELAAILNKESIEVYVLRYGEENMGLLELDFTVTDECELVYFGLVGNVIGKGLGKALMHQAIELAWSRDIKRFWVHTCTFDSPSALPFYKRSGFIPYACQVEVQLDPRLLGILPMHVAPHVPVIIPESSSNSGSSESLG